MHTLIITKRWRGKNDYKYFSLGLLAFCCCCFFSLQSTENTTNVSKNHNMYEPFQTKINANYV